ncbi:MAG TPA: hypothetical protein VFU43_15020 [Streptosporangiaceae bacterium]|nr:hypothetical protein [Streptosporangiaceae bacterium]
MSIGLDGPVRAKTEVSARSSRGNGTQANVSVDANAANLLSASVNVGVDTCGFAPEVCGMVPPPVAPPGVPPVQPPGNGGSPAGPPGVTGPSTAGPGATGAAATAMEENLPVTGGPLGALAGIGLAAVLGGAVAVGGSRIRFRRAPE